MKTKKKHGKLNKKKRPELSSSQLQIDFGLLTELSAVNCTKRKSFGSLCEPS